MFFQIAALVILAAFYGCYFGKMAIQRKKGIRTNQMGKGKVGFVRFIEIGLKVVTILVPIGELICICFNLSCLPDWARWIGLGVAVLGAAAFICSVVTMKDSWRAGVSAEEKTELVTSGIYKISRNPAFLGFGLVYAGVLLMFFHWGLFVLSELAAVMLHLQIVNVEEDHLLATFGGEYLEYRKQVNRYLGRKRKKS